MASTKEIFREVSISYMGIELNKMLPLRRYGEYLCEILDSEERHTTTLALNTGSIYYHAMAVAAASLACLFYRNTDVEELIENLSIGDMLIVDGERVRYQGIIDGGQFGAGFIRGLKYFVLELKKGARYVPIHDAKHLNISIYQGEAEQLGGKGVRATFKSRREFLSDFKGGKPRSVVSTEIGNSVAIVSDREMAEGLYRSIHIGYNGKKVALADLVTAAYYSENDCYQIGSNPTKEEPILKFYSKISACRDDIVADRQKRIIGCLIADENLWLNNSEIHDIADRKSLKFSVLEGKTHYTKYCEWFELDDYLYYAAVPETISGMTRVEEFTFQTQQFKRELDAFSSRDIRDIYIEDSIGYEDVLEVKRKILKIKKEAFNNEQKEDFLITSYFLLNLCRSAFFPLAYCDKAKEKQLLSWTLEEKLGDLKKYANSQMGGLREDALCIIDILERMIEGLYESNPKAELVKEYILKRKVDCIVTTKAYYEAILSLWLDDCDISINLRPRVITVSAFEKSEGIFYNTLFITGYYDFSFNPYASFGFISGEVLLYGFECYQAKYLKRLAERGRKLIQEKNYLAYDVEEPEEDVVPVEQDEDEEFETEMDKMARDLQLKGAYRYLSSSNVAGDGLIRIEKIFTFASGSMGFFTKHYKGYRISGTEISEVDLENLKVGDSIVFTKETENKDIVDLLLNQLLENQYKNTKYPEYYRLSICWKIALRKYIQDNNLTYQEVSDQLRIYGCTKHQVTIRSWLYEETHIVGPREESDYAAIVKLVGLNESPADIKKACDEIRSLRMKILDLLGKAIIRGMSTEKKDELWDIISSKAEGLSQIEQITSINEPGENNRVPMYMINKPCNI